MRTLKTRCARIALPITLIVLQVLVSCTAIKRVSGYRELKKEDALSAAEKNEYDCASRRELIDAALSLVGRVNYFWGGKYNEKGENPDWGKFRTVTSSGHSTSGTELPLGLDCSGYVSWCFMQIAPSKEWMIETVGEGTWKQWFNSKAIEKDEVTPGDLAFSKEYPGSKSNHVGIVIGFSDTGEPLIAHCNPASDNVVVSTCGGEFVFFRRTVAFDNKNG